MDFQMKKFIFIITALLFFISCNRSRDVVILEKVYTPPRVQVVDEEYDAGYEDSISLPIYEVGFDVKIESRYGSRIDRIKIPVTESQFKSIKVGDTIKYFDKW